VLIKYPGIGKAPLYSVKLGNSYPTLALDSQGDKPVIWLARTFWNTWESPLPLRGIQKVVDLGDKFSAPVTIIRHRPIPDVFQIAASPINNDVFVHSFSGHRFARVDGQTGDIKLLKNIYGHDVACGPEGHLFVNRSTKWSPGEKTIEKYDRDGNPVKFSGLDSHGIKKIPGNISGHATLASKGFSISPLGDIVTIDKTPPHWGVSIYGADGLLKTKKVIDGMIKSDGSPVMDFQKNLYIAASLKPADKAYPGIFGKEPPNKFYNWMYGSIIKFPPEGGKLYLPTSRPWPPPKAETLRPVIKPRMKQTAYVEDAIWIQSSFSALPGGALCGCYTGRFTVDNFGRVYIPDTGRFSILIVDSANNEILRFGSYGNEDSAGPKSRVPEPEIPLSWPHAVTVGKNGIYISDFINRRIVRVNLTYAAETTINL